VLYNSYMKIGAHCTTAGGLISAVKKAQQIGAECMQIFSSAPQQWSGPVHTQEKIEEFVKATTLHNLYPVFIHGTYLMNLASENQDLVQKSKNCLTSDLKFASSIKATGVIFHFGSRPGGWEKCGGSVVPIIREILDGTPKETKFIIENSAGSGNTIGSTLEELTMIQKDVRDDRLAFCIDTAHAFAAGYDIRTKEAVEQFVNLIDTTIGWSSVVVVHANDSKAEIGDKKDRHEDIGKGFIGISGFRALIRHPKLKNLPFILETPGGENREGPNKENIDLLRSLI
jgi:deoxyribonuclease IV